MKVKGEGEERNFAFAFVTPRSDLFVTKEQTRSATKSLTPPKLKATKVI